MFNKLPKATLSEGLRGELGIDKNVNEASIDKYLNLKDSVYIDLRMLVDDAIYENIGGDSYLSGYIKGFEILPYPHIGPLINLPAEVGGGYTDKSLFTLNEKGEYIPVYEESFLILDYFFPKNVNIFIMCGGGGYAGMMRTMLIALGYDASKIYNIGGYWNYKGSNKITVKRTEGGSTYYDFWKVPYHNIDFNTLNLRDNSLTH